jgi:hypothetical protein
MTADDPQDPATLSGGTAKNFPHLFSPLQVGGMQLRNRVMAPPHASAIGNLWGSPAEADRNIAYWRSRAEAGVAWIDGATGHVSNTYIPGFEPSGPSAETIGYFRLPYYVERARQLADSMHAAGAVVTAQLTMIAGVPHAPSARRSDPIMNAAPHVLNTDEIDWFIREYAWSARQAQLAGLDGIVTGGDVSGLVRAVVRGPPDPGADDRDVHGVEQLGESLDELAIVAAELDVKDVDGVGQGVGQELAGGPVGAALGAAAEMVEHGLGLPTRADLHRFSGHVTAHRTWGERAGTQGSAGQHLILARRAVEPRLPGCAIADLR